MDDYKAYWNDVEIEKKKSFWIEDPSDMKIINFLTKETNLQRCFLDALQFADNIGGAVRGDVLDIGAGVGWTSAIVSRIEAIQLIMAIDYSVNRLEKIAPIVMQQLGAEPDKVKRVVGDFFSLELQPAYYDAAIFCQSAYMFSDLERLFRKVNHLLVKGGILIVACERIFEAYPLLDWRYIKQVLRRGIYGRADISGNHNYVDSEYRRAIKGSGFDYYFQPLDYYIFPKSIKLNGGNYFGIKR